jgi:hypothetical protein
LLFFSGKLQYAIGCSQSFAVNTSATYGERRMPEYVLGHHLKGEGKRLALMSELLDPIAVIFNRLMSLNQGQERWKSAAATAQFPRGLPGKSLRMDEP